MRARWLVLILVLIGLAGFAAQAVVEKPRAALIPVTGTIGFAGFQAKPSLIMEQVKQATDDPLVEALVFQINSPGGSVVASRELERLIQTIEKPTICWLGDVATSGAYLAASACKWIIADELTLTGSFGVSASYIEFSGLMDRYGVNYERLVSARYKDLGSPYRNLTQTERELMLGILEKIHSSFVTSIALNRGLTRERVEELSDGSLWLGAEALKLELVDRLGGRETILELVEELTGKRVELVSYERKPSLIDLLAELVQSRAQLDQFGLAWKVLV